MLVFTLMGTIVLNRQVLSFVITLTILLLRKRLWRSHVGRAFKMEEAGMFMMHRCPRATHTREREVTRWPVRPLPAVITMMGSSHPCRGQRLVSHLSGGLKSYRVAGFHNFSFHKVCPVNAFVT